jgi:hypothetical protein
MIKLRIILILAVVVSVFALYLFVAQPFTPPLQRIEYMLNTTIPISATEIRSQYNGGFQDNHFFLRMKLPADDFPDFMNSLCLGGEASLGTEFNWQGVRKTSFDWWITDDTPISISGQCILPAGTLIVEIFVDQTDSALYELYVLGSTA